MVNIKGDLPEATENLKGLMSAQDKTKLNKLKIKKDDEEITLVDEKDIEDALDSKVSIDDSRLSDARAPIIQVVSSKSNLGDGIFIYEGD